MSHQNKKLESNKKAILIPKLYKEICTTMLRGKIFGRSYAKALLLDLGNVLSKALALQEELAMIDRLADTKTLQKVARKIKAKKYVSNDTTIKVPAKKSAGVKGTKNET